MVFLAFVCMFTQLKSVNIVIKLIVHYNYQCQLLSVGFFNPFDEIMQVILLIGYQCRFNCVIYIIQNNVNEVSINSASKTHEILFFEHIYKSVIFKLFFFSVLAHNALV